MAKEKTYRINPETLRYEVEKVREHHFLRLAGMVALGLVLFLLYLELYVHVLGLELPKTILLKRENARLSEKVELLSGRLDAYERALGDLGARDNGIYRSVYGLDEIPEEVRGAGFSGVNRYADLEGVKLSELKKSVVRVDVLLKRAYLQSKSYDEVESVAAEAGDRISHIPAICPISTDPTTYHLSSPFGYRSDPMRGYRKFHSGMDFACPPGNPVYATGDGVVIKAEHDFFGYGNNIIISHGFGYKTRYAHLKTIEVEEGEKVIRGQRIGLSGNTGRSTEPHLHYEVIYRNEHVNPYGFMDLTVPVEEYEAILSSAAGDMETGEGEES